MTEEQDRDEKAALAALMGSPWFLSFDEARAAIRTGIAAEMFAAYKAEQAAAKAKLDEELQALRDGKKIVAVVPDDPDERKKYDEHKARLVEAWRKEAGAGAVLSDGSPVPKAAPVEMLLGKPVVTLSPEEWEAKHGKPGDIVFGPLSDVGKTKPPGSDTLAKIKERSANVAQKSEPEAVTTGGQRVFIVCRKCLGAFVHEPGAKGVTECQCGAARFGDDGEKPFSEMGIRLQTSDCIDVTPLVECGKLSAVMPTPDAEKFPHLVILAVHNKTARNVPQRKAVDVVRAASDGFKAGVLPASDYMHRASLAGAAVLWHSHYHTRACGVDKTDTGDYLRHEATGDARFCGQVIVRDQKNEADGSLLFKPVFGCARCGKDHKNPLAFWKLKHPVWHEVAAVVGGCSLRELVATHFAYCPDTGEPIMMISSEGTDADGLAFQNAAEADFRKPAPDGKVEQAVNSIDNAGPIDGPQPDKLTTVPGVTRSQEFDDGRNAGLGSASITSDPHPPGSERSEQWRRGFIEGRSAKHGE